jgi:hypothetical protein
MHTVVYIPTAEGDVLIEKVDAKTTTMTTTKLSHMEKKAIKAILDKFKVPFEDAKLEDHTFTFPAKIEAVHKVLTKCLKKDRATITAVKLADGSITEVLNPEKALPTGDSVTVEKPARGCPPRAELPPRDVRATRVLEMFLDPAQLADFNEHGAVCVIGHDTGHRYSVCHPYARVLRHRPHYGKLVADLETGNTYCSYAMHIPPAEEMLAHVLMISLREKEWIDLPG